MTKRLTYIDTARAILITLVVLGHALNYANPQYNIIPYTLAQEFINAFHMPAFFLLSGLLTDGEKWRSRPVGAYFVHKAKTLLMPYLFFECLAIFYKHFALHSVSLTEGLRLMLTVRCNVGADWFLPAMFLACALYYLYIRFPHKILWGVGGTVLLLGLRFLMSTGGGTFASAIVPRRFGLCVHAGRKSAEKAADGIQVVEDRLRLSADGRLCRGIL